MKQVMTLLFILFSPFLSGAQVSKETTQADQLTQAEENKQTNIEETEDPLNVDISGVVVDRTMTRFGAEFYRVFSQLLSSKASSETENLVVKERATAMSGSIISIFHDQKLVYRTAISPARQQIEFKAKQAVEQVDSFLLKWKVQQHFQDTFDLAKDEI